MKPFVSDEESKRKVEVLKRLLQTENGLYANVIVEGPLLSPINEINAIGALYPLTQFCGVFYLCFELSEEANAKELRKRIPSYTVRDEVAQKYGAHMSIWGNPVGAELAKADVMKDIVGTDLPFCFIAFGWALSGQPMATLFHHYLMPPQVALEWFVRALG